MANVPSQRLSSTHTARETKTGKHLANAMYTVSGGVSSYLPPGMEKAKQIRWKGAVRHVRW